MRVGFHVSISGGLPKAVDRAVERGCETIQVFVSNPRGWRHSRILPNDISTFRRRCEEEGLGPIFVHTIYLINLASPDREVWERSIDSLVMNMQAAAALGSAAVVTHLGSHGGEGEEFGMRRVMRALELSMERAGEPVPILIETTAGSGNSVGDRFSQLGRITNEFAGEERLGVCLDTCHVFAAGYELRMRSGLEATMDELDREVGMERLGLVHANDSKGELGSRIDRHESIGNGRIGMHAFELMAGHPGLRDLPWILETPGTTVEMDLENMRILRSLAGKEQPRG